LIETVGLKKILSHFGGVTVRGPIVTFRRDTVNRAVEAQDYSDFPKEYGPERPGPPCVRDNEIPVALQRLHMYKVSYEYSRNHAQGILDVAGWLNAREARLGKTSRSA
jgi:hypothetical protein